MGSVSMEAIYKLKRQAQKCIVGRQGCGGRVRFPFGWVIFPIVMLSLNYFQSMCLYTGQWVTF